MNKGLLIAFIGVLISSVIFIVSNYRKVSGIEIGEHAENFTGVKPDGSELKLSDYKGKIVILDFWASWCGPCKKQLPELKSIYQKFKSVKFKNASGFEIISISWDKNQNSWMNEIKKKELNWEGHILDKTYAISEKYKVNSIPRYYLLDQNGKVIGNYNNLNSGEMENKIRSLIN